MFLALLLCWKLILRSVYVNIYRGPQLSWSSGRWYVNSRPPWPNSKTQFSKKKQCQQCELLLILCFWFLISCPLKSLLIFMKLKVFQGWRGLENQILSFIIPMRKKISLSSSKLFLFLNFLFAWSSFDMSLKITGMIIL